MLSRAQTDQFTDQGYVVIDHAAEPDLLAPLRDAAKRVTERARRGTWPHVRAVGNGDIWGVQNLLHPDLDAPAFADYLATPVVVEVARDLLGVDPRLGLVNLLVNPVRADFAIGWHRDLLRDEVDANDEIAILRQRSNVVQWNTALYDDSCLLIVPASHRRASTKEERDVQFRRPMDRLSGQLTVRLSEGQGVYYNNLLIHRGIYPCGQPRASLHAAMARADADNYPHDLDALKWMASAEFRARLPESLLLLYDRWLAAYERR